MDIFPEGDPVLQPRVAVLGYPGKDGGKFPNPTGVAPGPHVESAMNSIIENDARQTHPDLYAAKLGHNPGGVG